MALANLLLLLQIAVALVVVDFLSLWLQENPDLWKWLTGQEQPPDTITSNPVRKQQTFQISIAFTTIFYSLTRDDLL